MTPRLLLATSAFAAVVFIAALTVSRVLGAT